MYGLTDIELQILKRTFAKYPEIQKAILFGSRAKGNFKNGSDIDIVIITENKFNIFYIYDELEEKLPYFIDIILYNSITNKKLKNHIKNFGKIIYKKEM